MDDLPKDYTVKQTILYESTYDVKWVTIKNVKVKIVTKMRTLYLYKKYKFLLF